MKEYLTIKEFSKISGIEQTTLRYWDDIGLFSPTKRDPENNYRYYTPGQIIAVNFITVLSKMNTPLKKISELGPKRTPEVIMDLIEQQEMKLDMEMRRLREQYSVMHARRELINNGLRLNQGFRAVGGVRVDTDESAEEGEWVDTTKISVLHLDEKAIILGPGIEWKERDYFYEGFMSFCNKSFDLRINLSFPIGGFHDNLESFSNSPGHPNRFYSMDPTGNCIQEAGKYIVGFSRGYYGELGDLPARFTSYIKEHSIKVQGPVYTVYLLDELCMVNPGEYLAQVCVAVA